MSIGGYQRVRTDRHVSFAAPAALTGAVDDQPGDLSQRRPARLSGNLGRPGCMGTRSSTEALQTGQEPGAGWHRGGHAPDAVVARANRGLAPAYLSERPEPSRVTRDD